jgi:hypothetical protein
MVRGDLANEPGGFMYRTFIVRKISFLTLLTMLTMLIPHPTVYAEGPARRDPTIAVPQTEIHVTSLETQGPIVGDGGFELGTPNPEWEEYSTWFDTPICDLDYCGPSGTTGPHTGDWWAWFGGIVDKVETGILTQTVTIPSGSAALTFWLAIPSTDSNGFLSVRIDGTELFRVEEDTPGYETYVEVNVDISTYADGGTHELVFFGTTDANPQGVTNFYVDDVAIMMTTPTTVYLSNFNVASSNLNIVTLTLVGALLLAGTIVVQRRR